MPPAARLRRRTPSGLIAYPLVMVDGEEKAGKTVEALTLSASPRVGSTFAFDLGEGRLDEYGSLGPYEVVDTNGTWLDFIEQVRAAAAEPMTMEEPNVIVVDTGTGLWKGMLCPWVDSRARRSKKAQEKLAEDPDAEIDAPMNLWNDAKDRWREFVDVLRDFPGIAVVTARGGEVSAMDANGRPIPRTKEWSSQVEKSFPSDVSANVRMLREPRRAQLQTAVSLAFNYEAEDGRPMELPLARIEDLHAVPGSGALHHLVFDLMRCGELATTDAPQTTRPSVGLGTKEAKTRLLAAVRDHNDRLTDEEAIAEAGRIWTGQGLDGRPEVTFEQMADALTAVGQEHDEAEKSGPGPAGEPEKSEDPPPDEEPPTPAQEPQEAPAEDETPNAPEERPSMAQEFLGRLDAAKGRELRDMADAADVAKGGTVAELRDRLRAKLLWMTGQGPHPDAEATPAPPAEEAPAEEPPAEPEPEATDIPEDAIYSSCVCGMDIWRHLDRKTFHHVDPELDKAHAPEESF